MTTTALTTVTLTGDETYPQAAPAGRYALVKHDDGEIAVVSDQYLRNPQPDTPIGANVRLPDGAVFRLNEPLHAKPVDGLEEHYRGRLWAPEEADAEVESMNRCTSRGTGKPVYVLDTERLAAKAAETKAPERAPATCQGCGSSHMRLRKTRNGWLCPEC